MTCLVLIVGGLAWLRLGLLLPQCLVALVQRWCCFCNIFLIIYLGAGAAGCCGVAVVGYWLCCLGPQLFVGLPQDLLVACLALLGLFRFIRPVGGLLG